MFENLAFMRKVSYYYYIFLSEAIRRKKNSPEVNKNGDLLAENFKLIL